MDKPTIQEWEDWANLISTGNWHTTMLQEFCRLAVIDRKKLETAEQKLVLVREIVMREKFRMPEELIEVLK